MPYAVGRCAHTRVSAWLAREAEDGMDNRPPSDPPGQGAQSFKTESEEQPPPPSSGRPAESSLTEQSAELYFLIANFLTNASPCSRAAAVLRDELVSKALGSTTRKQRRGHPPLVVVAVS